jgi:glutamate N-acetyltransferase/amino-acid N-acetyltransferase
MRAPARKALPMRKEMARITANALGCSEDQVLVASTGVIGVNLKMDKIRAGVPQAVSQLAADGGAAAARAIMTTDPFPKEYAVEVTTESDRSESAAWRRAQG